MLYSFLLKKTIEANILKNAGKYFPPLPMTRKDGFVINNSLIKKMKDL